MRTFKIISIILFALILLYPIRFFNRIEESISLIDNRKLFKKADIDKGDLTNNIEKYVNDRIGGRNFFIKAYTLFNDKLFNVMVHPTYTYGKSGYVFLNKKETQITMTIMKILLKWFISFPHTVKHVMCLSFLYGIQARLQYIDVS